MDKWAPEDMLRLIDKYRVTNTHMVPTQFVRLLGVPEDARAKYDMSSLRHMVHAAAPCPPDVKRQMIEWWGPVIDEYYAASEGGGTIVFANEWLEHPGTVGRAWPISEIAILDDDGNDLPTGQIGTVYMHMLTGNFEYFKDKDKTEKSFKGKFFTVGDVGFLDDDGWLFLSDRKNDMIISGGANIYPAEIESELIMHPKVADVAVFGIPHDDWGEEVKAVVEPIDGVAGGPELEAEMLGRLLVRLGTPEQVAQAAVARQPEVTAAKVGKRVDGQPMLAFDDQFDRAWRRVGLALDRVGFTVVDRDRQKGMYFVKYVDPDGSPSSKKDEGWLSKLAFWRSEDTSRFQEQYRIVVTEAAGKSQVTVQDKNGTPDKTNTSEKMLALLLNQLK